MFLDRRFIYIILALMVIMGLRDYLTNPSSLLGLLLTIPGLLIAISFHEFAHALAADKLGDDTPRQQGRLTLNPITHLDPIGSLMLLFARFGWGRPVEVNPRNYDRRMSMDKADAIVSLAGPLMNFVLAIVFTIIYFGVLKVNGGVIQNGNIFVSSNASDFFRLILTILQNTIAINIGLGVFNLIPLPPLDGSKIIKPFLPYNSKIWFENNEQLFRMLFVALWIFHILENFIGPIIQIVYTGIINFGIMLFRF